jgi:hypothetical protein
MLRKKFIFENEEDEPELNDFQKILALNKKRISRFDVEFYNSEGEDFSDTIEVTQDGLMFTFDGLKDFLQFFFPDYYEEGNGGEYDASNYEWMYSGNYDWYDEFSNRSYDDWSEGYVVSAIKSESLKRLKEILNRVAPHVGKYIEEKEGAYRISITDGKAESLITDFLGTLGFEEPITDAYIDAQIAAVNNSAPEFIKKTYCNCLTEVGVENYSERHCFWKYELDWGSAILLFARFGTEDDRLLDLLFEAIKNSSINHLPESYEIQHYCWDNDEFNRVYVRELDSVFDKLEERLEDSELYNKEYFEVINKVSMIGGVGNWIKSKNKKLQIKINSIDPETLKIDFSVAENNSNWSNKKGRSTIDDIINLLNYESMYGIQDFREHYLKFLQKTIL